MRKFLIATFFFISVNASAQHFTLDELITLYKSKNDVLDTYATNKNYILMPSRSANDDLTYFHQKHKSFVNSIGTVHLQSEKDTLIKERCIIWAFEEDSTYKNFKQELYSKGYEMYSDYSETNEYWSGHHFLYTNSPYFKDIYYIDLVVQKQKLYLENTYVVVLRKY